MTTIQNLQKTLRSECWSRILHWKFKSDMKYYRDFSLHDFYSQSIK